VITDKTFDKMSPLF